MEPEQSCTRIGPPGSQYRERRTSRRRDRLAAENAVFRRHAAAGTLTWRGGLLLASAAFAAGMVAGYVSD